MAPAGTTGRSAGTRRLLATGAAASVGLHGAVVACILAATFWPAASRDSGAPPAVAIELMPEPAGPATPPRETPPEPAPTPDPVTDRPKPDSPDIPEVADATDAVVPPAIRQSPPPPEPKAEAPPPPSISQPAPKAVAAAPSVGQPAAGARDAQQTWEGKLLARLEQKKRYPAAAARNGLEDVVYVRITMDRKGKVLASAIVRSRGLSILDDAVRDLVERADPLPALPDSIVGQQYAVTVPIDFFVRQRR